MFGNPIRGVPPVEKTTRANCTAGAGGLDNELFRLDTEILLGARRSYERLRIAPVERMSSIVKTLNAL